MKNYFSSFAFILGIICLSAQPDSLAPVLSTMDTNNIKMTTMANGDMGWDYENSTTLAPKGGDVGFLFASSLWLGAPDYTGDLHVAANTYKQNGFDFWAGPVANSYDVSYDEKYNRSWTVSSDQIMFHREQFSLPGYVMPEVIKNWPGNGDTNNGENDQLAPFYDINTNGLYEPHFGDFPLIRGDKAVFVIYNDDREAHANSGGTKFGAEIHMMMYAFDSVEPELDNTVFVHYEVYNRGVSTFLELYAGMWNDWDLGSYNDDVFACDKDRNVSFVYNRDDFDGNVVDSNSVILQHGYGNNPPAAGLISLNEDMYAHMFNNNNSDPKTGNPEEAEHYFNYLNAKMKDGSIAIMLEYPLFWNNFSVEDTSDLELSYSSVPRDRRSVHSQFIPSFLPGESFCLDFAYVFAENTNYTAKQNAVLLMDYVDDVQLFYDNHYTGCTDHTADFDDLSTDELSGNMDFDLLKNASSNIWVLNNKGESSKAYTVHIINALGQDINQVNWKTETVLELDMNPYAKGVYFLQITSEMDSKTLSLVKE